MVGSAVGLFTGFRVVVVGWVEAGGGIQLVAEWKSGGGEPGSADPCTPIKARELPFPSSLSGPNPPSLSDSLSLVFLRPLPPIPQPTLSAWNQSEESANAE